MNQLAGLANNTKWKELQALMSGLGSNAPFWRRRSTNGYVYPPQGWDGDWTYHFRLGEYKYIEWCEMSPRDAECALDLDGIIAACKEIGFEFEQLTDSVKIIGYRRF
ncbi:DUF6678 family protein [Undibacterium sp. Dicai25W]|uniref:DUF6678 family protein n=1 Tax=Undibacterium sp. Dicai25W TaxID=3413034 RepID=UPI003BF16A25